MDSHLHVDISQRLCTVKDKNSRAATIQLLFGSAFVSISTSNRFRPTNL